MSDIPLPGGPPPPDGAAPLPNAPPPYGEAPLPGGPPPAPPGMLGDLGGMAALPPGMGVLTAPMPGAELGGMPSLPPIGMPGDLPLPVSLGGTPNPAAAGPVGSGPSSALSAMAEMMQANLRRLQQNGGDAPVAPDAAHLGVDAGGPPLPLSLIHI